MWIISICENVREIEMDNRWKSQHATNYVIFKELVKSLPHLGQKSDQSSCCRWQKRAQFFLASFIVSPFRCVHVCNQFDFQGKQNSSEYKIFIFVLLSFRSLFTVFFFFFWVNFHLFCSPGTINSNAFQLFATYVSLFFYFIF